jgi:hypothetical protein
LQPPEPALSGKAGCGHEIKIMRIAEIPRAVFGPMPL